MVATDLLEVLHFTFFAAPWRRSFIVLPTSRAVLGTSSLTCRTVTLQAYFFPPKVAVILAVPPPTAFTVAVLLLPVTVATFLLDDAQVTLSFLVRPFIVSLELFPAFRESDVLLNLMAFTVTVQVYFLPLTAAVILAFPAFFPVTRPLAFTEATAALLELHVTFAVPAPFMESWVVAPTPIVAFLALIDGAAKAVIPIRITRIHTAMQDNPIFLLFFIFSPSLKTLKALNTFPNCLFLSSERIMENTWWIYIKSHMFCLVIAD